LSEKQLIKGINHIGISVVNLERSLLFYRDLLGLELVAQDTFGDERYDRIFALERVSGRAAILRKGNFQVELFEFARPKPKLSDRQQPVSDHGITHFCIEVVDIEREYERLKSAGVRFHCSPFKFAEGTKATYGRDPDGNAFELLEVNAGVENKGALSVL
jgi:catechol 2,3-dioxygenase-like lactoylglutathione lyase family enzyme